MAGLVRYEMVGAVAWITIDRPEQRNALNAEVRAGLWEGFARFRDDDGARVLVVTGAGDRAFSAGADLKEMSATGMEVPPRDFIPQPGRNIELSKPTIAAVNGLAWAGGFALAQGCDLCIAAEHATFAISEAKVGRGAPWAAPLAGMVPRRVALEILLTAAPISAQRAFDVGLINAVVPADELRASAQAMAELIAANAPLSVAAGKAMVDRLSGSDDAAFDVAEAIWEPVYRSKDAQEGPLAFREGRPPRWEGC